MSQREDVKPVFWWDGDTAELCSAFELKQTAYHTIPLYTQPQSAE